MREPTEKPVLKSSKILNTHELACALGDLVRRVERATQLLKECPLPVSENVAQLIDTTEARNALGWQPDAALAAGDADESTKEAAS